ncbi:MAG: substrate-binding domain-containing protein [Phycisphaerae bacterium]
MARYAQQAGWHLWSGQRLHTILHEGWTGDGLITNGLFPQEWEILYTLSCKLVLIDHERIPRPGTGYISTDNRAVGHIAFEHFRQRGFGHYAWSSRYDSHEKTRADAFEAAAEEAGYSCRQIGFFEVAGSESKSSEFRNTWLREQVESLPRPVGILAVNDDEAVDILEACEDAGLAVPEEVAVLGVGDNVEVCQFAPRPLSSVQLNREKSGWQAAALLDRLMAGENPPDEPILVRPGQVTCRLSTDIVAVNHVEVARAMRFIWANAHEQISVDDVVEAVALSRRSLFSAFRKHLGRTPHQEILRRRMEIVTRLLRDTELKVYQIAEQAGFGSVTHLYQAFSKQYDMPPRQYRQWIRSGGRVD